MEEIKIEHLTKIEGHAKLRVRFDKRGVKRCALEVFESPRYFEALVKGRDCREVPYLAGRICGICNVAHLTGSIISIENALGIEASEQTGLLRKLLVLGGIMHSHTLQLYMLALPDYLGCSSALDFKGKNLVLLKRCLDLKEVGNDIVSVIGGRSMHPLTAVVGGFTKIPKREEMDSLVEKLEKAKTEAMETLELFKSLKTPEFEFRTEFLALERRGSYPFTGGVLSSLSGMTFEPKDYQKHIEEKFVSYSSSKHVSLNGKSFMVGPLARLNLSGRNLSKDAFCALEEMKMPCHNIFQSNLARAIETVHCIDRCISVLEELRVRKEKPVEFKPGAGEGVSATEAPRGTLFHHYKLDKEGRVTYANIIPPTTQNVRNMEDAIKKLIPQLRGMSKNKMTLEIEKLMRAYDPCMSCSAHFLELEFI